MRVAALDLGTNSFLLLVQEKNSSGAIKTLHDESVIVRLGEGLQQSGFLSEAALTRAETCLSNFHKTILQWAPDRVEAVTTAAAREASNAKKFLVICEKYNIPVRTLSGAEEARMSYRGAVDQWESKRCCVIDIGGGSTETILGERNNIHFACSLSYGAVKMTEKFITNQPTPPAEIEKLRTFLRAESQSTWDQLLKLNPEKIIAVAGTPTAIAACEIGQFDAQRIENRVISCDRLEYWVREFASLSIADKKAKYPLGKRADVILAGAVILQEILKHLKIKELFVSTKGIRYGLSQELLSTEC